jgi:hypothetical protein
LCSGRGFGQGQVCYFVEFYETAKFGAKQTQNIAISFSKFRKKCGRKICIVVASLQEFYVNNNL